MRSGYEFAFDPGHGDLARAAAQVAAAVGAAVVTVPNDEGIRAYTFGVLANDRVIPMLVMPNVWASDECATRYPMLVTLEAEQRNERATIRALAVAIARRCFVGQPLCVTRGFDRVVFEGRGARDLSLTPASSSRSEAAPASKAYAVALARAQEAGYSI